MIKLSWILKVKEFQSLPNDIKNKYCGLCGCIGGCNLCEDISKIKENDIYNDL